jgi:hypothetical protein
MSKLSSHATADLLICYRNAASTDCGAIGHTKGRMNANLAEDYAREISSRGTEVPEYYAAAEAGTYNGRGSWGHEPQ